MTMLTCDNESGPGGVGCTSRGLTRSSEFSREGIAMKATRPCTIDGCDKPILARGWCAAHWTRWNRHGDPLAGGPFRSPTVSECTVDGCDLSTRARGLCAKHWRADMAASDPEWRSNMLAKRREWFTENLESVAEGRRRSRERNGEADRARLVKWRAENRHVVLMDNWRRRRRAYGLSDDVVEVVDPAMVYDRAGGLCQICLTPVDESLEAPDPRSATVDHIVPVVDPTSEHSYANTQLAHFDCNRRKSATSPTEETITQ
jgi:5-methylcytosine-specific restriction endonuclease McrA